MNTKIFVAYHAPAQCLNSDIFTPVHVGSVLKTSTKDGFMDQNSVEWMEKHCIRDDVGENISHLNRRYCELTAIYWVWKNIEKYKESDYIGFMHYRRHLRFNNENVPTDKYGLIHYDKIDGQYIKENSLFRKDIENLIRDYDVVVAEKWDVRNVGSKNLLDHYKSSSPYLKIKDYNCALGILKQQHPEYKDAIESFNNDYFGYFTNIFIMKKDVFIEYCNWLFPILNEFDLKSDVSLYNLQEYRVDGYISEWLFGIWLKYNENKMKIKELQRTMIDNPNISVGVKLKKQFDSESVNICMATDDKYIKYLTVALQSIKENSDPEKKYDISILASKDALDNIKYIKSLNSNNFKLRIVDVERFIDNEFGQDLKLIGSGHITRSAYYRLFIPILFSKYEKVLYLDSDLVVDVDLSILYECNLGTNLIAGVIDFELIRWYLNDGCIKNYIDNKLEYCDVTKYINSGVCLMNIKKLNEMSFTKRALDFLSKVTPLFHDQDVINKLCFNRIKYIESSWNVEYHIPIWSPDWRKQIPLELLDNYIESREKPKIVHFAGGIKPWQKLNIQLGEYFWKYARLSPVYEQLMIDLINSKKQSEKLLIPSEFNDINKTVPAAKYKYKLYKILKKITFNKVRKVNKSYMKYRKLYKGR